MNLKKEIMGVILSSEEWNRISCKDPEIQEAEKAWTEKARAAQAYCPDDIWWDLDAATVDFIGCIASKAILYGFNARKELAALCAPGAVYKG